MNPELDVRCDADMFVDQLYRIGEPTGPEVYAAARLSRFVCDLNRDADDVSPGAVPEHPAPRNSDGRGLHLGDHDHRHADAGAAAGAGRMARAHGASTPRTTTRWRARSRGRAQRFGYAILVDGHSMPSRGRLGHKDPAACAPTSSPAIATAPAAPRA